MAEIKCVSGLYSDDYKTFSGDNYKLFCEMTDVYEFIPDNVPVKLFADIDIYDKNIEYEDVIVGVDEIIKIAKTNIERMIKYLFEEDKRFEPVFTVCNSNSPSFTCHLKKTQKWKVSLHIIAENILATKKQQEIFFKFLNKSIDDEMPTWRDYFPENTNFFDTSVYKNDKFRAVFASKPNEKRPLVIQEGTFEGSVITGFFKDANKN